MACRGWYTALLPAEAEEILSIEDPSEVWERLDDLFPAAEADGRILLVDKAWDAMHRVLCGGWLDLTHGDPVLQCVVIGGLQLSNESDWIISYVEPAMVSRIVEKIAGIEKSWFREQFFALDRNPSGAHAHRYEGPLNEDDFEYTWSYFTDVRDFYGRAAERGLATVFGADQ